MKAIVAEKHGGLEVLEYRDDVPVPEIGPNDVLLKLRASALNHNALWARTGLPGMEFKFPHISGTDGAGVVEAVGSEVQHVCAGDEVLVNGAFSCGTCYECIRGEPTFCPDFEIWGFQTGPLWGAEAEYSRVPARNVVPRPKNLSWEEAATIGSVLVTSWRMLVVRARMKPGDSVLIWGATGGLGVTAIQLCKALGATVIAVANSEKKCQLAADLGADHVIDRSAQRVARAVSKITHKRGVDIVFEHVGASTWQTSTHCLKWGGTIVTCGATTGFKAPLDLRFLWNKEQSYLGSHFGSTAELVDALRYVENGQVKPVVMEVLPLREVARGHEILESGEVFGKIAVVTG
jgi:NADPH:quinone reductase-like Zn-dependent oxidoreductase